MTSLLPLVCLSAFAIATTQALTTFGLRQLSVPTRRYYDVNTSGNEGQYIPDDSGSYNHDDSGSYRHDNSGDYVPDNDPYVHNAGSSGSDNGGFGGAGGSGGFGGSSGGFGAGGGYGSGSGLGGGRGSLGGSTIIIGTGLGGASVPATTRAPSIAVGPGLGYGIGAGSGIKPGSGIGAGSGIKPGSGISAAGNYGQPVALKQGNSAGFYDNRNYKIIRKIEHVEQDGYNYLYETENGIFGQEEGRLANKGTDDEAIRAKGYFSYTGPDNVVYTVEYTADENGFVPSGAHLPTPPPIPEAILRSLEYQRSIGEL